MTSRPLGERDFVLEYSARAPLALALERALECRLLASQAFARPVLDVGCGDGLFAETLFGRGGQVDHGLDLDPAECARARVRGVYDSVLNASATAIPLPDRSVRTVLANSTLEHLPSLETVLTEIARVLDRGGTLYATVPSDRFDQYAIVYRVLRAVGARGAAERFRRAYDRFWRHHHYYPADEWVRHLERAGLRVDEVIEYDPAGRCALHDALVPLAFPAFVLKKLIGRYVLIPPLRRALVRAGRGMLPADRTDRLARGTGGLVFLRAVKS